MLEQSARMLPLCEAVHDGTALHYRTTLSYYSIIQHGGLRPSPSTMEALKPHLHALPADGVLVGHQIHAVPDRGHQGAVGHGVDCLKLISIAADTSPWLELMRKVVR